MQELFFKLKHLLLEFAHAPLQGNVLGSCLQEIGHEEEQIARAVSRAFGSLLDGGCQGEDRLAGEPLYPSSVHAIDGEQD